MSSHSGKGSGIKNINKGIKNLQEEGQVVIGIIMRIKQDYVLQRHRVIVLYLVLEDAVKLSSPRNHVLNPRKSLLLTLL